MGAGALGMVPVESTSSPSSWQMLARLQLMHKAGSSGRRRCARLLVEKHLESLRRPSCSVCDT